ncbi:hypothetical protein GCM10027562_23940 [Arthrobacter pigmenti]
MAPVLALGPMGHPPGQVGFEGTGINVLRCVFDGGITAHVYPSLGFHRGCGLTYEIQPTTGRASLPMAAQMNYATVDNDTAQCRFHMKATPAMPNAGHTHHRGPQPALQESSLDEGRLSVALTA